MQAIDGVGNDFGIGGIDVSNLTQRLTITRPQQRACMTISDDMALDPQRAERTLDIVASPAKMTDQNNGFGRFGRICCVLDVKGHLNTVHECEIDIRRHVQLLFAL